MPAQKRSSSENLNDEDFLHQHCRRKQSRREREAEEDEEEEEDEDEEEEREDGEVKDDDDDDEDEEEDEEDSDDSFDDPAKLPEFLNVVLSEVRKSVQCPICLGIIKKTRTVMECMHRFCRECIDKSMRLGNNECPACRTHCASRRSLRDDPRYDALIEALYSDIAKYEEEELTFHEEERNRNKQIQASIAQISRRQSEALVKRRPTGKDVAAASPARAQRNCRNAYSRKRRNSRGNELQGSDDNEDENDNNGNKDSSSPDERGMEMKERRCKRRIGSRSQPSPSAANSDGGCTENDLEAGRESRGISPVNVRNPEILAWVGVGARSHTRRGSSSTNKVARGTRLSKIVDHLKTLAENDDELDVQLMLVSLDKQRTPSLQQIYHSCRPSLSVKHLCEYVARQTTLRAEDVEMLVVKEGANADDEQSLLFSSTSTNDLISCQVIDPCKSGLQILEGQETLAGLKANCISSRDHLIIAYRQKEGEQKI